MNSSLYKLSSLLIQYPDKELIELLPEISSSAVALPKQSSTKVGSFIKCLENRPLIELQEDYVRCFDFNKTLTLYLSFHSYGDRRQRGMAMLQLKRRYATMGLELNEGELPDYLPVLLEFAACAPADIAVEVLQQFRASLEIVRSALRDDESPYELLLDVVLATLPKLSGQLRERVEQLAQEGPPSELVGLEPFAPPSVIPGSTIDCEAA